MAFSPQDVGQKLVVTGQNLVTTGERLHTLATEMTAVAERLTSDNVVQSLETIEVGTRSIRDLLRPVVLTLRTIASGFRAIVIPNLDIQTQVIDFPVIGRVRFVTGVSVSSIHPFLNVATDINSVAEHIENVRKALLTTAKALDDLQNSTTTIRNSVNQGANDAQAAGDSLIESGTVLQEAGNLLQL